MPNPRTASGSRSPSGTPGTYDLVVVGAGPAGLAGAVAAAERGLSVALLDGDAGLGGQFYRHPVAALGATRPEALHHDWSAFAGLRRRWEASGGVHLPEHHVWTVASERTAVPGAGADGASWAVHAVTGPDGDGDRPAVVRGRAVLLATGAAERQLPFPGWTLPGVIGAGGAQAMLKSGLVLPGIGVSPARAKPRARGRVVVAGSGPLLLAVASSLVAAGARVPAVVEAAGYLGYVRRPGVLAAGPGKLAEAVGHLAPLLVHGVRPYPRHAVVRAHGAERVEAVTVARLDGDWRPVPGTQRRISCDAVAVGHGLVPRIDLGTALGCATRAMPDGATALVVDAGQRTTVPGLWSAGETAGVGGARLAMTEGELAGTAIAVRLRGASVGGSSARTRSLVRARARLRAFASLMAAAHAPGDGWYGRDGWLDDETEVCRCEEVSAGRVREAVESLGAGDARTVKLLTRAGMGWCQGRVCGPVVACLARGGSAPGAALPGSPERRPLAVPVTLGALAALEEHPDRRPDGD